MDTKKPWESTTIQIMFATMILSQVARFIPALHEAMQADPTIPATFVAFVGIVLRLVTNGKITLKAPEEPKP